jgi:hypothetical protein
MDHYPHSIYHELIFHGKQFGRLSTARQDNSWDSCKEDNTQICHYPHALCNDLSIFLGPQYRGRTSPAILLWG